MNFLHRKTIRTLRSLPSEPARPEFRAQLRRKVIAAADGNALIQTRHPALSFVLAFAVFALVAVVATQALPWGAQPHVALAQAFENTFSIMRTTSFHHQKIEYQNWGQTPMINEIWLDGQAARIDSIDGDRIVSSQLFAPAKELYCVRWVESEGAKTNCDAEYLEMSWAARMRGGNTLEIRDLTVERADNDPYGDLYVTWKADRPLRDTQFQISSNASGAIDSYFSGTYSWTDEQGETVYRVTLNSSNLRDQFIRGYPWIAFQIAETYFDASVQAMGELSGDVSDVYEINLHTFALARVPPEDLDNRFDAFQDTMRQYFVSPDFIEDRYREYFADAEYYKERILSEHISPISIETASQNRHSQTIVRYELSDETNGSLTTVIAEFTIDDGTDRIVAFTLFDRNEEVREYMRVIEDDVQPQTPPGFFEQTTWEKATE